VDLELIDFSKHKVTITLLLVIIIQ